MRTFGIFAGGDDMMIATVPCLSPVLNVNSLIIPCGQASNDVGLGLVSDTCLSRDLRCATSNPSQIGANPNGH